MSWPGFTQLDRVRSTLKREGWSNAVSSTWRCPPCNAAAAEAGMAKARENDARDRRDPGLFSPGPRAVIAAAAVDGPLPFVVVVCGGRHLGSQPGEADAWTDALDRAHRRRPISLLREGGASGADWLARRWAEASGIPVDTVKADWSAHGRAAGPTRNAAMLVREPRPDVVIAAPGGAGTADMVARARAAGVLVWEPMAANRAVRLAGQAVG